MNIQFKPFEEKHLSLWEKWITLPHIKNVWFIEGYETTDYILQKIKNNGYDFPFVIFCDEIPIGYIQCSDLYAYRTICSKPKGLFTEENPGTFCMDLFIADEKYLNRGYGTDIVKSFVDYVYRNLSAKIILIDPAIDNKRAIRCYEKAGFQFVKEAFDGVTNCYVMQINKKPTVEGLSHITLICQNLEKTANMLQQLFDAKEVYSSGNKTFSLSKEKFFTIAGMWFAIMEGGPVSKTYNHIAFKVNENDMDYFLEKVQSLGLEVLPGRSRNKAEGQSLYFYDYDNHLFELHSGNLDERLQYYAK